MRARFFVESGGQNADHCNGCSLVFPLGTATDDYADSLITHIRSASIFPLPPYLDAPPGRPYTEPWRRRAFQVTAGIGLVRAWDAAKVEGVAAGFTKRLCGGCGEIAQVVGRKAGGRGER